MLALLVIALLVLTTCASAGTPLRAMDTQRGQISGWIGATLGVKRGSATAKRDTRNDVARKLGEALRGTPLYGHARELERVGYRLHVHPAFMAGAAGFESSYGTASCQNNPRNIWGLGSCGRAWSPPYFTSWPEAFAYYARFIRSRWPSARTPYELYGYCECGADHWGGKVAEKMRELGFGTEVRYP